MKIILVATEKPLLDAWKRHCSDLPGVEIRTGGIIESGADAAVCPLSSNCKMDRGISLHFKSVLGAGVEERLGKLVREYHGDCFPVGAAEMVATGSGTLPYLIAAPLLETPQILKGTTNPLLAARAALKLVLDGTFRDGVEKGNRIADVVRSVAFPGLGTGGYQVTPDECAIQVGMAIREVFPIV